MENYKAIACKEVGAMMEEPFPAVRNDTPVTALSSLLRFYPAVIVSKKGKPVGIITRSDLLK